MATSDTLVLFVNGKKMTVRNPDPEMMLLQYLRSYLRLTGTKSGCKEGGCGACTVMLSILDEHQTKHYAVMACLTPLCLTHGFAVTTVEGIGSVQSKLHPVQRAIAENHGTQCGFCTPGVVMSVYALLRNHPRPTKQQLYEALDGNLCRCTGYRPILQGLYPFTKNSGGCRMGRNCCQVKNAKCSNNNNTEEQKETGSHTDPTPQYDYDPSQEIIFPPELQLCSAELHAQSLCFKSERATLYRPTHLQALLDLRKTFPDSKIIAGNTGQYININAELREYPVLISTQMVKELHEMSLTDKGLVIGSSVSLTDVRTKLQSVIQELPAWKTRVFAAFSKTIKRIAGTQIRNAASIGGNIITASPISDLNPLLLACRASLCVVGKDATLERREFLIEKDFFPSRKATSLKQCEVLLSVVLPFTTENEHFYGFKQATRKECDKATVNAGMYVSLDGSRNPKVKDICLAFGGMAAVAVMATKTMDALRGRVWDSSLLELACSDDMLPSDLHLSPGCLGGLVAYRKTLCLSLFFRFYNSVLSNISENAIPDYDDVCQPLENGESHGSQFYSINKSTGKWDTIGKPITHRGARVQCTGEALFMDDIPITEGELFLGLVTSTSSHARIISVDPTFALSMDGVVTFVDHRDVPGNNKWESTQEIFASDLVVHEGQVLGAIVATSPVNAQRAANAVEVTLEDLTPVITIQDSIKAGTIHHSGLTTERGNPSSVFTSCAHLVEGEMHVNAQEHFYLEPHGCVVYPKDGGTEIDVIATTQSTQMQKLLTRSLGLPANRINVHVKRIGGGFGGKETRNASIVLPVGVAALKTGRPVRCVLDRSVDMRLTGTRHPAYMKYKVGFESDGKITALDADLYLNMGSSLDLSLGVLEIALLMCDNAYNIDNLCVRGHLCETNLTSCTAFRAYGAPQSMVMAEEWISHVADALHMSYEEVRKRNFYKSGDIIPCGQKIMNCNIQRCWDECFQQSEFDNRQKLVEEFNRNHTWKKRGIAMTPLKYGLAFLEKAMNQGAALVNIYTDGTVLAFHGGVEMGQGLHTKLIQVVSRELEIPIDSVHTMETSGAVVPNTGPTATSVTSDLYRPALIDACKKLLARLAPYKIAQPKASLKEWATAAHQDQVPLSACGFFCISDLSFDWAKKDNNPFPYFSFGAACSEVEIDCLTGDHKVLRTDIVMDVGQSLNPAIDVGQIEGAFVQGYGMYMLEDYKVSPEGIHNSTGPSSYKIPSFGSIPTIFNVSLLKDSENPRTLYSSKGIGEPPLCLASSILVAVRKAVNAARKQNGLVDHFQLDTPATPDKLRMLCGDMFSQRFTHDLKEEEAKPWNVKL